MGRSRDRPTSRARCTLSLQRRRPGGTGTSPGTGKPAAHGARGGGEAAGRGLWEVRYFLLAPCRSRNAHLFVLHGCKSLLADSLSAPCVVHLVLGLRCMWNPLLL